MDMMEYIMDSVSDMSEKQLKCLCYFIQALKGNPPSRCPTDIR